MTRWSGARHAAAPTRRRTCRDCGAPIDEFRNEVGLAIPLETTRVPADVDITTPGVREWLYEWRGPRIGWIHKQTPVRTWRDLRRAHRCTTREPEQAQDHEGEQA